MLKALEYSFHFFRRYTIAGHVTTSVYTWINIVYKYRLYTKEKVSMGFIIPSNDVARLINPIETVPRCLTVFYHVKKC